MKANKTLPTSCPCCSDQLKIAELRCDACGTCITGTFDLPPLSKLSAQEQQFVLDFVRASGSLKDMAKLMSLSYPTVRNLLDELISKLK